MSDLSQRNGSIMERHLQTTIQIIIVAVLLWFGNEVTDNGKQLVKLTTLVEISSIQRTDHETRIRILELMKPSSEYGGDDADG